MKKTKRDTSVETRKFEQDDVQKAQVKVIVINELPFSVVEQDGFKELMEASFPGFCIPSPEIIYRDVAQLFMDEKLKLKSFIKSTKQKVSLTLDTWMSKQLVNYLCITAHVIDDNWNLHKKIISFAPFCSDNGEEMGRAVEKCLHDWEISNVLTISTGKATSYDAAISYLRTRLENTVMDGKFLYLRCVVDFINTMVKEVLNDHDKSIAPVRAAVRYVRQSTAMIRKFNRCGREYGKIPGSSWSLDCPARWNSTFEMLYVAEKLEEVFSRFERIDPTYVHDLVNTCGVPGDSDWRKVRKVMSYLKGFYQSAENIVGSYVTSNMYLEEIAAIDGHLDNSGRMVCNEMFSSSDDFSMALDKAWKFYEYWGDVEKSNILIYVANILDPRHKADFFEFYFMSNLYRHDYTDDGEKMWIKKAERVIATTYDLFNEYVGKTGAPQQNAKFETCGYMHYLYKDMGCPGFRKHKVGFGGNIDCKTEIDIYLNEENVEDYKGFDILRWWKFNSVRFPILSKMAKDVLAIPISAVALKAVFSISGCVLDDFQSSLPPSVAEALVCTQDWMPKPKKHLKVEEGSTDLDKFVKEIHKQAVGMASGRG